MSLPEHIAAGETGYDRVLRFAIPGRNARGRAVRLGPVLDQVLDAHDYPPPIRRLLAEALVLTALLGALLKDDGSQLTIQAQTQVGVVDLLVCDYRNGELRGYVRHDVDRLLALGPNPSLFALFGQGYLAVTFDLAATGQRYQGIVPLEGASLAEACESYFAQSEQVPTLIRLGIGDGAAGCVAGGILVQHLAEGE
ncbi:MAG: Hsp33 family molecular chaperone HslO, partial [Novosphingobium sp.]